MRPDIARIVLALAVVAVIAVVMLVTGWADDHAPPGSGGRAPVTEGSGGGDR